MTKQKNIDKNFRHEPVISSLYYYDVYISQCSCGELYRNSEALDRHIEKSNKKTKSRPISISIKATEAEAKYLRDLRNWEKQSKK